MASTQLPLASKNYVCSPQVRVELMFTMFAYFYLFLQLKNSSDFANMTSAQFIGIIVNRVFYMSVGMGLSINGHHSYCGDYIFSGHTVTLITGNFSIISA